MKKKIILALIAASLVALPTAASAATTLKGDINNDGLVSYEDLDELRMVLVDKKGQDSTYHYDINEDGKVDDADFITLKNLITPSHIPGDINSDGFVNLRDQPLIYAYFNDKSTIIQKDVADLNGDKTIDLKDYDILTEKIYSAAHNGDVNGDGTADYDDLNLIKDLIQTGKKNHDYVYDVNGDKKEDVLDLVAAKKSVKATANTGVSGDINGDNVVNEQDVVLLKRYLEDDSVFIQKEVADLDADGSITDSDLITLRYKVTNK